MLCSVETKELKLRPATDVHDYQVRPLLESLSNCICMCLGCGAHSAQGATVAVYLALRHSLFWAAGPGQGGTEVPEQVHRCSTCAEQFFAPCSHCIPPQVKVKAAQKFLSKGHRVKLTLQFRGREMEFQQIGREMFQVCAL